MDKPKVRTEFVASWKDWEGAVCVTFDDYEALEREVAGLREQLAEAHRCVWELPVFRAQSDK